MISLTYLISNKTNNNNNKKTLSSYTQRTDWWLLEVGGTEWVKWVKDVKRCELSVITYVSLRNV